MPSAKDMSYPMASRQKIYAAISEDGGLPAQLYGKRLEFHFLRSPERDMQAEISFLLSRMLSPATVTDQDGRDIIQAEGIPEIARLGNLCSSSCFRRADRRGEGSIKSSVMSTSAPASVPTSAVEADPEPFQSQSCSTRAWASRAPDARNIKST